MPSIGIVGQRRAVVTTSQEQQQTQQQLRPSDLSPTARNLARLLKTLQEPDVALQALQDALKQQGTLQLSNDDLPPSQHSFQQYCIELSQAVELAHAKASRKHHGDDLSSPNKKNHPSSSYSSKRHKAKSAYVLFYEAYSRQQQHDACEEVESAWESLSKQEKQVFEEQATALENSSTISSLDTQDHRSGKGGAPQTLSSLEQTYLVQPSPTTTEKRSSTRTTKVSALVSDSEDAGSSTESAADEANMNVDSEIAILDFWPVLLEAVHLQVASRTVRTWGKKKIYEVYRLAGPTTPVSDLEQLRKKLALAFLTLYDGSSREDKRCMRYRDCRVFCAMHHRGSEKNSEQHKATTLPSLWIQVSIGRPMDVQDELNRSVTGEKKKKPGTEFIAMLEPESNLVALTASRAASRSTFTPFVLSALEMVLTCSVTGGYASKGTFAPALGKVCRRRFLFLTLLVSQCPCSYSQTKVPSEFTICLEQNLMISFRQLRLLKPGMPSDGTHDMLPRELRRIPSRIFKLHRLAVYFSELQNSNDLMQHRIMDRRLPSR